MPKHKTGKSTTADAIAKLDAAQGKISEADTLIGDAIVILAGTEPPKPPDGQVVEVHPGDNLLDMVDQAPAGTVFSIDPGYVDDCGTVTLDNPVELVTAAELAPGRVSAALVGPQLIGSLTFAAPGFVLRGIRIEGIGSTMVTTGPSMLIDRCALLAAEGKPQQRGVAANSIDVEIVGSHIGGIYKDVDTQAVICWNKTKRLTIRDCFLEASGENFMSGGSDSSTAADMPEDILIEDCTLFKPLAWMELAGCSVKNSLELKAARRVVVRRCVIENNWAHGQSGNCIVLSIRNQSGKAPWSTIEDVLIEDITIRHVGGGVGILGRDDLQASGVMANVTIRRVTIEDLSKNWKRGNAVATGRAFQISGGPKNLVIEDCDTAINPGPLNQAILFDQLQHLCDGLVFRRTKMHEGAYGISGQSPNGIGTPQLEAHAPGYTWESMTIQRGTSGRNVPYPTGTTVLPPTAAMEYDGDPERLDDKRWTRFFPGTKGAPW
jgi:hypothetical protein